MSSAWSGYLRSHPFCFCGLPATEAHHIKARGRRGPASWDNSDTNLIALCRQHHAEVHSLGNKFWTRYGLTDRWEAAQS